MLPDDLRHRLRVLEHLGVALLLLAALLVRARDLGGGFDRGRQGAREASFAVAAVNYERFGLGLLRGYPAYLIDTGSFDPADLDADGAMVMAQVHPTPYLLGWIALKAGGPRGWSSTWREGRAPPGVELPLRLPFLLAHLLGLWALWWCLRPAAGAGTAMLALAFYAAAPGAILHAALPGAETLVLPCVFLALGAYARHARGVGRRALVGLALASFGAACATGAAAWLLAPLPLHALLAGAPRRALRVAGAIAAGVLLPIALHLGLSAGLLPEVPEVSDQQPEGVFALLEAKRASHWPEHLARIVREVPPAVGWPILVAAALGLVLALARAAAPALERRLARHEIRQPDEQRLDLVTPLALGVLLCSVAVIPSHPGRPALWAPLLVVPGACAAAAFLVQHLARPLMGLRAGLAPLVLVAATLTLPGLAPVGAQRQREGAPGPNDPGGAPSGTSTPLPQTTADVLAELAPPGTVAQVPDDFTFAHAFYAWRNLAPWLGPPVRAMPLYSTSPVLDEAPQRFLLPPWSIASDAEFEDAVERLGPPLAESRGWRAWSL